jgi:hypothetical protein
MKNKCNVCPADVHISADEIDFAIKTVIESGVPLAGKEQYENRLKTCDACDQLVYGTTCMSCGCLVKARALNALRICPHESGSKW